MENTSDDKKHPKTAHSTVHRHLTDYHDGGSLTNYLGNNDYKNGNHVPEEDNADNPYLEGKFAEGNSEVEEGITDSPEEKKNIDETKNKEAH